MAERMFQRLMSNLIVPPLRPSEQCSREEAEDATETFQAFLRGSVVVECSNVADYFIKTYCGTGERAATLHDDLRAICPPYKKTFYEWSVLPGFMGDEIKGMGLFVFGSTPDEILELHFTPEVDKTIERMRDEHNPKWLMLASPYIEFKEEYQGSAFRGPYGVHVYATDAEGNLLESFYSKSAVLPPEEDMAIAGAALVGILAQSMINCKNIITRTNLPPKKLNKARKKRGRKPLVSFKTIHVDPNQTINATTKPQSGSTADGKTRGPRRGHLKDYRAGKGLFGRYRGVYYFGPQLSGDAMNGICLPDYTIDPKSTDND